MNKIWEVFFDKLSMKEAQKTPIPKNCNHYKFKASGQ